MAHDPDRWMLALIAAGGFVAVLLIVLGTWTEVGQHPAFGLLIVVSAGLAGVLAVRESVRALDRRGQVPAVGGGAEPELVASPLSGAPPLTFKAKEPRWFRPHSGIGQLAVSATAHVPEEFWERWLLPGPGSLGAELIGPVPETAYFPPSPGALAPYSARDRDLVILAPSGSGGKGDGGAPQRETPSISVPPRALLPHRRPHPIERAITTSGTRAFSKEELDRLFPTDSSPPTPASSITAPLSEPGRFVVQGADAGDWTPPGTPGGIAAHSYTGQAEFAPTFSGLMGSTSPLEPLDHQVHLEAINPLPPHLRLGPRREMVPRRVDEVLPPTRSNPARSCTMCARQLRDFRSWADCPGCGDPICEHCLRLSFITGAEGHCFDCREASEWPAA